MANALSWRQRCLDTEDLVRAFIAAIDSRSRLRAVEYYDADETRETNAGAAKNDPKR